MKAVVLEEFGEANHLQLSDVPTPEPKAGEVRIQIKATGFNPVDYKIRQGKFGGTTPLILGADCSGIIDMVGTGVTDFSIGDEVYAMAFAHCSNGTYAEYLCLPVEFVAKKPKNISHEQAASVPVAALTAYRALITSSAIKKNDSIFIAGAAGGVGSFAIQLARFAGVRSIFTIAGSEESARFLQQKLGIEQDHILLYKDRSIEELKKQLISMNGDKQFDATFDFVGGEMKKLCINLTACSGHFATILREDPTFPFPLWDEYFTRNITVHLTCVVAEALSGPPSSWDIYRQQLSQLSQLFDLEILKALETKIVGPLSKETVVEAHRLLEERRVRGKLVMKSG